MITYVKPAMMALSAASTAIQGHSDKPNVQATDAIDANQDRTTGMGYDLDE